MTETQARARVVDLMRSWLGKNEAVGSHREIIDIYNSYTPHPRGYVLQYSDSWCAGTVSAASIKLGYTDIMPVECSCSAMIALYQALGRWAEDDDYMPKPGDVIFYDWQDSGEGDNRGAPDHVGIVESCTEFTITVIEGNYGRAVKRRVLLAGGMYIRGFGVPDYAGKAAALRPEDGRIHSIGDAPAWAQPDLQKLIDRGALHGKDGGDLDLSEDMLRCMIVCQQMVDKKDAGDTVAAERGSV